ncbi:hypothetical protein [Haploplasma modicum]|uniref:hypothetical protein n=1 Tax=Haploplasma modicum TaxID=2150 RepID=UPI00214B4647|nr:hypothetical protein [Haploplasma modicum]MCR1809445.1 hypothetical protein [Haploplasma modicum]
MKKRIVLILSLFLLIPMLMGAKNYNYSFYGEVISSTPGMTFQTYFDSRTLGVSLGRPEDLLVYEDKIYIIDSQENKLIIVNDKYELVTTKSEFPYADDFLERKDKLEVSITDLDKKDKILSNKLSSPRGLSVSEGYLYIADSKNNRVLKINENFEIVNIIFEEDEPYIEDLNFEPSKITVDKSGRVYVVIDGAHEGILELDASGKLNRFVGTNTIVLTPFEILRRSLMSEEQKKNLALELTTSYTNVNINEKGFIYATAKPTKNNYKKMIQLINPKGDDVLKRNGYHEPMGDFNFIPTMNNDTKIVGPSNLVDVAYTKNGIYTVLDQKRSRVFTYDQEGKLLYINGESSVGTATQNDKLETPVALDYLGDNLLILDGDQRSNKVLVLSPTEFGTLVNSAIEQHSKGNFEEASLIWEEVLKLNTNYEIAYSGIGKSLLRQKKYKEAMKNFRLGHDSYYYSKAFKSYRNEILSKYFGLIVFGIVALVATPIVVKNRHKFKRKGNVK